MSEVQALGGSSAGLLTILPSGVPPPLLQNNFLFKPRTFAYCQIGQIGCQPYCHCFSGCPNHPRCNSQGTLWESDILDTTYICRCNPGYVGNFCQHYQGTQLCNSGSRMSTEIDNDYYVLLAG